MHLSPNVLQDVERKMALLDLEGPSTEGLSSICPPLVFADSSTLSETEHRSLCSWVSSAAHPDLSEETSEELAERILDRSPLRSQLEILSSSENQSAAVPQIADLIDLFRSSRYRSLRVATIRTPWSSAEVPPLPPQLRLHDVVDPGGLRVEVFLLSEDVITGLPLVGGLDSGTIEAAGLATWEPDLSLWETALSIWAPDPMSRDRLSTLSGAFETARAILASA